MIELNAHYELYDGRGREPGQDEQDWLRSSRRSLHSSGRGVTSATARVPTGALGGIPMDCLKCKNLEQAFESRLSEYIEVRSAAYYRVSTELAAYKNVDMERARNDMEEHQLVCVSAAEVRRREPMIGRWSSCPPFSA